MTVFERISERAEELSVSITANRQEFHRYPESGWTEMRTTAAIARHLKGLGYSELYLGKKVCKDEARLGLPSEKELKSAYVRAEAEEGDPEFLPQTKGGFTGVIAELHCGEGPLVCLRFDIDALGVNESEDEEHRPAREGFASVHPGVMHACGHDGHTAVGLATAEILMRERDSFSGTIRLIFQPAEEGCRGAAAVVANGWLSGADYVIGNHVVPRDPHYPDCVIDPGNSSPSGCATTKLDVVFRGQSAHAGGNPQNGRNALAAASAAVLNLYGIPRSSAGYTRINVGTLHAGSGRNVIPDEAKMELEVRGETDALNRYMIEHTEHILRGAAMMNDCEVEMKTVGEAHPLISDEIMRTKIAEVCESMKIRYLPLDAARKVSGTAEDFGYMSRCVQEQGGKAVFFRTFSDAAAPLHDARMDFDETVLTDAVKVFCGLVWKLIGKDA